MADDGTLLLRSVLFAPANHVRRTERLGDFAADAVVLDLEDAVARDEKVAARRGVRASLARYRDVLRCVRVNALGTGLAFDDLAAVVGPDLDCVVVPKIESASEIAVYDSVLEGLEAGAGLPRGSIRLLPIVETARGINAVEDIASSGVARVITLLFGIGDYTADLGIKPTRGADELLYPRSRVVLACRAGRLPPPVDGPILELADTSVFVEDSVRSRELGFQGRLVIHPSQVAPANELYALLDGEELEATQEVVAAFEAALRQGSAAIQVDGCFVDYPIYQQARRRLDRHLAAAARTRTNDSNQEPDVHPQGAS